MELEVSHLQSIGTGKSTSSRVITTEQGSKLRNRGDNYATPAEHRHREEHLVERAVAAHDLDAPGQGRDCG